ncbi:hypothetical protein XOCgx_1455 [Xanthomonas oryzae pv. oryzicola]|nr:hypothetical protein XOCgx_1455 [Xanthomonas oryzae pv. oryzicola]
MKLVATGTAGEAETSAEREIAATFSPSVRLVADAVSEYGPV